MITNLSGQSEVFLANLARLQKSVEQAGKEVSSGKRVNTPSDAPDVIGDLLRLHSEQHRNTQIQTNLGLAKTDADVAEAALSSATKLLDRAITLAAQGATATQDASGRASLAIEVQGLMDQMVSSSLTQSAGRYVFSGDDDTAAPYQQNAANPNGVDRLVTATATRMVEDPAGTSFAVSKTAQDIFDQRNPDDTLGPANVFAALNGLYTALSADDVPGVNTSIVSLKQASDHLNSALAFYGTVQNRIQEATEFAAKYNIQITSELSQKEDADVVAASLELNQGTIHLQAAFQIQAHMPSSTLFDYLKV